MSGKKQQKTFERDNLSVEIVRGRVGKENAIGCAELSKLLNEKGYSTKAHLIHSIMGNLIKERYLPICSLNGKGYYFPKDRSDIEAAIAHLQSRADEIMSRVEFLKRFLF